MAKQNKRIIRVGCGDSAEMIPQNVDENSIHAVVTDPPYGLGLILDPDMVDWDKVLPDKSIWEACLKVMRPGAFLLAFGHVRLYHRLGCDLEDVGFKIKDCLCWCYASGHPRSLDIEKATDNPIWSGWGTQLKNAWEPIIMVQKPFVGTYAENVARYNVGGLNIDECRIPYKDEDDMKRMASFEHFAGKDYGDDKYFSANSGNKKQCNIHPLGRWPANLVWIDPMFVQYDHIFMIPKPSKNEKGRQNIHATVKPIELMERLIRLVTPRPSIIGEDVLVLDPFLGSGTTGIASCNLGRKFYGYEKNKASYVIAKRRLKAKVKCFDMFAR